MDLEVDNGMVSLLLLSPRLSAATKKRSRALNTCRRSTKKGAPLKTFTHFPEHTLGSRSHVPSSPPSRPSGYTACTPTTENLRSLLGTARMHCTTALRAQAVLVVRVRFERGILQATQKRLQYPIEVPSQQVQSYILNRFGLLKSNGSAQQLRPPFC